MENGRERERERESLNVGNKIGSSLAGKSLVEVVLPLEIIGCTYINKDIVENKNYVCIHDMMEMSWVATPICGCHIAFFGNTGYPYNYN